MDEEVLEQTSEVVDQVTAAPEQEQHNNDNQTKPEGWDQVEFTPEQKQRFDRVYKQTKELQRTVSQYKSVAQQQADLINELSQKTNHIVNHIQTNDFQSAENQLKSQRDDAFQKGDMHGFNAANDRLNQIIVQKTLTEFQLKNQQQQVQQHHTGQPISGYDFVDMAVQQGAIAYDDADAYRAWASEADDFGNLKRPWVNQNDIRNSSAAIEGAAVFNNPAYRNKSFTEKLSEIDRRMGLANRQPGQAVLPGGPNLTRGRQQSNIKLSPFQEKVAVKTKFAGPGKSEAEHLDAYRKQIANVKGSRK